MFGRRGDRTLVIRIAATTLASNSAKTIARFRPSKILNEGVLSEDEAAKDRNASNAFIQRF